MFAPESWRNTGLRAAHRCFNEAGACLPRKVAVVDADARLGLVASMRPGHVCPGKPAIVPGQPSAEGASMRPGHVCPGNMDDRGADRAEHPASMRPGHVCPGKHRPGAGRRGGAGFNEAGACLPRKDADRRLGLIEQLRFNEAGACLPRKDDRTLVARRYDALQ